MPTTWEWEIKKGIDDNGKVFWSGTFEADTIRKAKEKFEDTIRVEHSSLLPRPDSEWVVNDDSNCISRQYYQRSSTFSDNIDVYHLPEYSAIIAPVHVSLLEMPDYEERMLWEGI